MKKNLLICFASVALIFNSCTTDDTADIVINDNSVTNNTTNNTSGGDDDDDDMGENINLAGTYTQDLTLDPINNYSLTGSMIMASGTTLTIPAGTVINALSEGANVYIAISQGAKIEANGTQDEPIVLTSNSSNPQAGDWGGLIVLGRAPINSVTGDATATSEIASLPYGGTDASDNSGTLRYVRVEYSGGAADGQSENNGFSFYGVGNGTTVQYIQAFEGKDDGIEFFGGTVNASFVSIVNSQDDSIDWTEGYSGSITNAYVEHGDTHDKGIEADGYNTDIGNNSDPLFFSKPTVTNLTIVGLGSSNENEAIRLRAGTQGIFENVLLNGFAEGFDLDGDAGATSANPTGNGVLNGDLKVNNVTFTDVTVKVKNDTGETFDDADFISGEGDGTGTDYNSWGSGWTRN